jgi:hypothetical protein
VGPLGEGLTKVGEGERQRNPRLVVKWGPD